MPLTSLPSSPPSLKLQPSAHLPFSPSPHFRPASEHRHRLASEHRPARLTCIGSGCPVPSPAPASCPPPAPRRAALTCAHRQGAASLSRPDTLSTSTASPLAPLLASLHWRRTRAHRHGSPHALVTRLRVLAQAPARPASAPFNRRRHRRRGGPRSRAAAARACPPPRTGSTATHTHTHTSETRRRGARGTIAVTAPSPAPRHIRRTRHHDTPAARAVVATHPPHASSRHAKAVPRPVAPSRLQPHTRPRTAAGPPTPQPTPSEPRPASVTRRRDPHP